MSRARQAALLPGIKSIGRMADGPSTGSAVTPAEVADVDRWAWGAGSSQIPEKSLQDLVLQVLCKGTEMFARLVKLQIKATTLRNDRGATAVEYGLMVALIAIVIIAAVTLLGKNLSDLFQTVATKV